MNNLNKMTKIVATIGPATETEEIIEDLIKAGMNVARFNTKHGTPEWHRERIKRVRKVAKKLGVSVGILLDLQGPEIRINLPGEEPFDIKEGEKAVFTSNQNKGEDNIILIPQSVIDTLQVGHIVLLDDGVCEFEIIKKGKDYLTAKALGDFPVKHRKTLNTPGVVVELPSLIDRDYEQLDGADVADIDFIGLSFVRDKEDISILRKELKKRDFKADIIAKIENQAALDNIDEIIEACDGVMVARGDLAVEVPFEQLTYWQKLIIDKCRLAAKPVITATQMLKSMVDNPRPTRAEVSDVANAVYDMTSAVMLSDETTIGEYPVKCVETQAKIVSYNEKRVPFGGLKKWVDLDDTASLTHAALLLSEYRTEKFDAIICLTETGRTVKLLSRFKPKVPIFGITNSKNVYFKLSLAYGVSPILVDWPKKALKNYEGLQNKLMDEKIVKKGQTVLLVYGHTGVESGLTDTISIMKVK